MNLHRILQISKGLPPDSLHDMLFARKLSTRPTETVTVSGYPCVLENSAGKPVVDYKIYGNTVQDGTPMPDNPVEVKSVGDKTKNLFNENDVTYGYWINQDGSIETSLFALKSNANIDVVTGKTICAKAYGLVPYDIAISYYDKDNAFILRAMSYSGSFVSTPPSNAAYGVFCVAASNTATIPITPEKLASYKIVLTYGESTEYYPYGYKLPVVVTGKNLWDDEKAAIQSSGLLSGKPSFEDGVLIAQGTDDPNYDKPTNYQNGYVTIKTDATFMNITLSFDMDVLENPKNFNENSIYIAGNGANNVTCVKNTNGRYVGYFNFNVDRFEIRLGGFKVRIYNIQIEDGNTATAYEPYHEPITTNIYLDEPLRKIGDYADVIDYERGVVERNTIECVFTGDEPFGYASSDENRAVGSLVFGGIRDISVFFSNMFHVPPHENTEYNRMVLTKGWLYVSLSYELIGGSYYDSDDTKIANIVNWLKERYESGNPLTVVATHKSTTEPISIPSIPTFDGTTVISTDTEIQPSNMEIKYKARKLK